MLRPSFTMESPERLSENARKRREAAESLPDGRDRATLLIDAATLQTLAETIRWLKALRTPERPET